MDDPPSPSPLETSVGVRALSDVVVSVAGDDVREWLQGQVTNDVCRPEPGSATYALVTTVKGRILGDVWVLDRGDDGFWLVIPEGAADAVQAQLDRQIIMEDVDLARPALAVVTAQGPAAAELDPTPAGAEAFPVDRLGVGGLDFITESAGRDALLAELQSAAESRGGGGVDPSDWERVRIARGVPAFGRDFDDSAYPQEAGLARAVSFTKGCYVGQEVVCRLEQRGRLSRRLVALRMHADASGPIEVDGTEVGRVTSSAPAGDGLWTALGYVKRTALEAGDRLTAGGSDAEVVRIIGAPT